MRRRWASSHSFDTISHRRPSSKNILKSDDPDVSLYEQDTVHLVGNKSQSTTSPTPQPLLPDERTRRVELIIKLGGSALTVKGQRHTLHPARFSAAMDAIARLHNRGIGFIVVHGAGSFGHFEAREHTVSTGEATPLGVSATHAAVTRLNAFVVDALVALGVPAIGVAPLLVPTRVRNDFIAALLDRGHLPILHGDAVYSGDGKTAILSGDALVANLANAYPAVGRVVFLSDVPGILARPPEECRKDCPRGAGRNADAETAMLARDLVRRVVVNEAGEIKFDSDIQTATAAHDVTGGIASKVIAAAKCVADSKGRITAFIAGVGTNGAEEALMGGGDRWVAVGCTRICYEIQGVGNGMMAGTADRDESKNHRGLRISLGTDDVNGNTSSSSSGSSMVGGLNGIGSRSTGTGSSGSGRRRWFS